MARHKTTWQGIALVATLLLVLAGCGGGGGGGSSQDPGEEAGTAAFFRSFAPPGGDGGTAGAGTAAAEGTVTLNGEVLAARQFSDVEFLFSFAVEVDVSTFPFNTTFSVSLPEANYDFFLLLEVDDGDPSTTNQQYGGITRNKFVVGGGVTRVPIITHPILGPTVEGVHAFRELGNFVFPIPAEVAQFTEPRFGVSVSNDQDDLLFGSELIFSLNPNLANELKGFKLTPEQEKDLNHVKLFLPAGTYVFQVRFYDGALVEQVQSETEPVTVEPGDVSTELSLVDLTAEANYNFTPGATSSDDTATFDFTVPLEVIDEAGGPGTASDPLADRLTTVASIVGPENALVEQELTLSPVTDGDGTLQHYTGQLTITPFVPGKITWQLSFVDAVTGEEFAYCAETVDTTDTDTPDTGTFVCDLSLLERALTADSPVGTLDVSVSDNQGLVPGAVVLLDGEPLGITGGGSPGESLGALLAFLKPGDYTLEVVDEILDPFGSGQIFFRTSGPQKVRIDGGSTTSLSVTLPPFEFGAPRVIGTSPADGAVDVPVDTTIAVTFSHSMDRASAESAFHITPATSGTFSWSTQDTVMIFTPSPALLQSEHYKVTIDADARDTLGTVLKSGHVFSFDTGTEPDLVKPEVIGVSPTDGATGVVVETSVSVTFSEAMDTTATGDAFSLSDDLGEVPGSIEWSSGNTVLKFLPDTVLDFSTPYSVAVTTAATDTSGNPLAAAFSSTFTTGTEPDETPPTVVDTSPVPGAMDVPVESDIVVTFSEPMDPGSLDETFSVSTGLGGNVSGNLTWNGSNTVVTFSPALLLEHDTTYKVTVGGAATDTAGNAMGSDFSFSFRTVLPPVSPTVLELEASRTSRPRRFHDGFIDLSDPTTVRIPALEQVQVVKDDAGNPLGNPDRFLLMLFLGDVKCMYLGGKWDRHIAGVAEDLFEDAFKTPVCTGGLRGLDSLTIEPAATTSSDDGDNDGEFFRSDAEIKARVITGDPFFDETRLRVTIEVVTP